MMKIFLITLFCFSSLAYSKEISISFDDAPRGDNHYFPGEQRAGKIIKALKKVGVDKVIFYSNPGKIKKDKEKFDRLMRYHKAGHLIGNHTFDHLSANKVTSEEFLKNFNLADDYLVKMKVRSKFFRYPYLRRGETQKKINTIHKEIIERGYIDGYVTVDNYDFYMDHLFQQALKNKKKINFGNLKKFYVETLMKSVRFFDNLSTKELKHEAKHVLLLHENDLAALFIEDLIFQLKLEGWKIISPEESYKDLKLSKFPTSPKAVHGQGRVVSLLTAKGYKGKITSGFESEKVLERLFTEYGVVIE